MLFPVTSRITHLSLRNNRIGEEGARLIGSALSTANSDNKNLLTLNMAFNSVGDGGAIHIAQVLNSTDLFVAFIIYFKHKCKYVLYNVMSWLRINLVNV